MLRYIKIIAIIGMIAMLCTGCSGDRFIDRQARAYTQSGGTDDEAYRWLIENDQLVGQYLARNLSSPNRSTAGKAKTLLKELGDDGIKMVGGNYQYLGTIGIENFANTIAQHNTNEAVLQLLALSTMEGGLVPSCSALLGMDSIVIKTIEPLLYQDDYYDCVNYILANYPDYARDNIIPMMFQKGMTKRTLEILAISGSDNVLPLLETVFAQEDIDDDTVADIASIALINNKDIAVDAIINIIANAQGNEHYGAIMLYEMVNDTDCSEVFQKCATSINAYNTEQLLKEYIKLLGIGIPLQIALDSPSDEIIAALSIGLDDPHYASECFIEIVKTVKMEDNSESRIYDLAGQLISDMPMSQLAQSIIDTDTEMMHIALSTTQNINEMGRCLSETSGNAVVYERMRQMLQESYDINKKNTLKLLAIGQNDLFPRLVWDTYNTGTATDSQYALDALLASVQPGVKFHYTDFDYMVYADRIVQDLKSDNEFTRSGANQLIERIPETSEYNSFYLYLFDAQPTQSVFQTLCMHHYGQDALPIRLTLRGSSIVISQIDIDMDEIDIDDIPKDKHINYKKITYTIMQSTGIVLDDDADFTLNIDIEQDPSAKKYSGLVSKSYLGVRSEVDIAVYVSGKRQASHTGSYQILLPEEVNLPETTLEYKQRPTDAPLQEAYEVSLIDALYQVFGVDVLYGTFFYNRDATMEVAKGMWE